MKKLDRHDVARLRRLVATLGVAEKDEALAFLLAAVLFLLQEHTETNRSGKANGHKEKEIEDILSVGTPWLRYTRRIKRKK